MGGGEYLTESHLTSTDTQAGVVTPLCTPLRPGHPRPAHRACRAVPGHGLCSGPANAPPPFSNSQILSNDDCQLTLGTGCPAPQVFAQVTVSVCPAAKGETHDYPLGKRGAWGGCTSASSAPRPRQSRGSSLRSFPCLFFFLPQPLPGGQTLQNDRSLTAVGGIVPLTPIF